MFNIDHPTLCPAPAPRPTHNVSDAGQARGEITRVHAEY